MCWTPDAFRAHDPISAFAIADVSDVLEIAVANEYGCARTTTGVACWHIVDGAKAHMIGALQGAVSIAAGSAMIDWTGAAIALMPNGTVLVFDPRDGKLRTTPIAAPPGAARVELSQMRYCVLGAMTACSPDLGTPLTLVPGTGGLTDFSDGSTQSCGRTGANQVMCWRWPDSMHPYIETPPGGAAITDATAIAAAHSRICVLHRDGTVSCWGVPFGDSPGLARDPVRVDGLTDTRELAVGVDRACARDGAGTVRCWGTPELGVPPLDHIGRAPTVIPELAGGSAFVITDGRICARFATDYHCVGDPASTIQFAPRTLRAYLKAPQSCETHDDGATVCRSWPDPTLDAGRDVTGVAFDLGLVCVSRTDGRVECHDSYDQTFLKVPGLPRAATVIEGAGTVVLGTDGTVTRWREASRRYHYDDEPRTPTQIPHLHDAIAIAGADDFGCALRATGQLTCWGTWATETTGASLVAPIRLPHPLSLSP